VTGRARLPLRSPTNIVFGLIPALLLGSVVAIPAAAAEPVDAVWQERKIDFTYISLDMAYSCELLQAKIEMLLRHLGARQDDVTVPSCGAFVSPRRQLRLFAEFSTLVPAGAGDLDVVKAAWKEVELGDRRPRTIEGRDCELLEQFQEYVLPEIGHRVIDGTTGCDAVKRSIVGRLRLEVLVPVAAAAEAPAESQETSSGGDREPQPTPSDGGASTPR